MRIYNYAKGKLESLKLNQLNTYLQSKNPKTVIIAENKVNFVEVIPYLGIKDVKPNVLLSKHNALLSADSLIMLTFTFFYFEKNQEKSCSIKIILSDKFLVINNQNNDKFLGQLIDSVLSEHKAEPDELGYILETILNSVFDHYFSILIDWHAKLENIENHLLKAKKTDDLELNKLAVLRKHVIQLNKNVEQQMRYLSNLETLKYEFITKALRVSFKNIFNKAVDINKTLDKISNLIVNTYNLYLTVLSIRQNKVSQILTIVATIFLPISFLTGFFGMNFYMPFLNYHYAWLICAIGMFLITGGSLLYFKRKRWL